MKAGIIAKALVCIGLLAALVLLLMALVNWNSIRIHYHVTRLEDAQDLAFSPKRAGSKFSMRWVRWLLEGRPDQSAQWGLIDKEQDALVKLGYCEQHKYTLTNCTAHDIVAGVRGKGVKDTIWSISGTSNIEIFAVKEDFPAFEKAIRDAEQKKKQ